MEENKLNHLYPVFLKLNQLETLLVGAGNVAQEKLNSILGNSPEAHITIVAPRVKEEVRQLAESFINCTIIERPFEEKDLDNKHLVICATDDRSLHELIRKMANLRKIILNVADTPQLCDAYLGSIVQKGSVKIAISTNGKSPTIAKRLKELLADLLPDEMEELLENMQKIRSNIKGDFEEKVKRLNAITKDLLENSAKQE